MTSAGDVTGRQLQQHAAAATVRTSAARRHCVTLRTVNIVDHVAIQSTTSSVRLTESRSTTFYRRGRHVLGRLRHASKHLTATQTSVLLSILKHNAQTTYGRRHRFTDVLEAASTEGVEETRRLYVSIVPLSTYDHYVDDIRQLFDSEDAPAAGILTTDRVEFLCYSSGTTGKNKLVALTRWSKVSIP